MDPLLDEKVVLTIARITTDFFKENLFLSAVKEAYGPSSNEGLCYENVSRIGFSGDLKGHIYFCMDGYTKLKLLPRIAERFGIDPTLKGMASSVILEFSNQLTAMVLDELILGGYNVELEPPADLSHKLVPIEKEHYRQYVLIFFLRDRRARKYLGRLYVVLTMQKFELDKPAEKATGKP